MSNQPQPPQPPQPPSSEFGRVTRRAFAAWLAGGAAAFAGWWWLRSQPDDGDIPWPLRRVHRFNEQAGRLLFSHAHLAPEFPPGSAGEPKPNGRYGMPDAVGDWKIAVEGPDGPIATLSPQELFDGLPRAEHVTELKCIEGWSQVVHWGGVRFADAAGKHGWPVNECPFVSLHTPDGGYYVGLDTPSALHPQTLLCDAMNGEPLTREHGAPLRLVIPVKYGIKNLKWLARIRFHAERPADYWAERGYDWYAGL